jgi:hypothetical protein
MRILIIVLVFSFLFSCNGGKNPDVSDIKISLQTQRFEQDFFAVDTNNVVAGINALEAKYPSFTKPYLIRILGADANWGGDTLAIYVKDFMKYYASVYDSTKKEFTNFKPYEAKLQKAFQYMKYYFPNYKLPTKLITFIGPANGVSNAPFDDAIIVGLQAHLGKDFPLYQTESIRETYPDYVSRDFTPDFIEINTMKGLINDLMPNAEEDKRLVIQMVENGKRLYLLQKLLPKVEEHKLMNYTAAQLKDCYAGEARIWDLFLQNNYLQMADADLIKNFVSPGPKTQELGEDAPGNIGTFSGWQIVKKYANNFPKISVDSLMRTNSEVIFKGAKYKP